MAPITLSLKNNYDQLLNVKLSLSDRKMYKNDTMFSYHNVLCEHGNKIGQLQIVCSNLKLPIGYAGNGAVLVKLRGSDNPLLNVMRGIERQIMASAPSGMVVKPLVKEPDQDSWCPSLKLKTDRCAIHKDSNGTLQQGCVLERCLITVSRMNHYQGSYYGACYLKSAQIGSQEDDDEVDEENLDLLNMDE